MGRAQDMGGGGAPGQVSGEKELGVFNQRKKTYFLALWPGAFSWPQFPFCAEGASLLTPGVLLTRGRDGRRRVSGAQWASPYGWCLLMVVCLLAFFSTKCCLGSLV